MKNIINIENYELFFTAYYDNELTVAERKMVEDFVQENIWVKDDFEALALCKITSSNTVFPNKEKLIKKENILIDTEKILLYIDDELPITEKIKFEKEKISEEEIKTYSQLKLSPDVNIFYPDKEKLLKKENAKIIPIPLRWSAVAAVLILGVIIGVNHFTLNNNLQENNYAVNQKINNEITKQINKNYTETTTTNNTINIITKEKKDVVIANKTNPTNKTESKQTEIISEEENTKTALQKINFDKATLIKERTINTEPKTDLAVMYETDFKVIPSLPKEENKKRNWKIAVDFSGIKDAIAGDDESINIAFLSIKRK